MPTTFAAPGYPPVPFPVEGEVVPPVMGYIPLDAAKSAFLRGVLVDAISVPWRGYTVEVGPSPMDLGPTSERFPVEFVAAAPTGPEVRPDVFHPIVFSL